MIAFRSAVASWGLPGVVVLALGAAACGGDKATGPAAAPMVDLISCLPSATSGDGVSRGFYVSNFPGTRLDEVTLWLSGTAGPATVILTARNGGYNGAILGTDTVAITQPAASDTVRTTFALGGAALATGDTVAFILTSNASTFYSVLTSNASCPITQTNGTTLLTDLRRAGIAAIIRGAS